MQNSQGTKYLRKGFADNNWGCHPGFARHHFINRTVTLRDTWAKIEKARKPDG